MTYTVAQVAERYGVSQHTVLRWIAAGELRAIDVSRSLGGRPRWRISSHALAAWEALRTPTPAPSRARRRRQPEEVVEWY